MEGVIKHPRGDVQYLRIFLTSVRSSLNRS
jgi:hypothetical protein